MRRVQAGPRVTNWFFTLYSRASRAVTIDDHRLEWVLDLAAPNSFRYCVYQLERAPTTGRLHLQGFIQLYRNQGLAYVKKLLKSDDAHLEPARNVAAAIDYCKKEESRVFGPWEIGSAPVLPGQRTDLESFVDAARTGLPFRDLIVSHAPVASRSFAWASAIATSFMPDRYFPTHFLHCYGPSGSGKTRIATRMFSEGMPELAAHVYWKDDTKWWDGYNGQEIVVIDDFDHLGPEWSWKYLLSVLDAKPFKVQCKGGYRSFISKVVYITSLAPMAEWYPTQPDKSELLRRLADYGSEVHISQLSAQSPTGAPTPLAQIYLGDLILDHTEIGKALFREKCPDMDLEDEVSELLSHLFSTAFNYQLFNDIQHASQDAVAPPARNPPSGPEEDVLEISSSSE